MEVVAASAASRKVMLIADPGRESAGALEWALYHSLVEQDELILLHVENAASWRNSFTTFLRRPNVPSQAHAGDSFHSTSLELGAGGGGDLEFLDQMKKACQLVHPNIKVHTERVDMGGKDKASVIVAQCEALSVDVLVIGQRRSISNAILGYKRGGGSIKGIDTAEYLIENSKCTCIGVQKKGQHGGYVLNTKTHRNFWLLA